VADTEVLSTSGTVFSRDARGATLFFMPCLFSKNWDMSEHLLGDKLAVSVLEL
jgi:uncharacterized Fe-S radical SAM superfamily protein PflX